jgi:hypothetical protein
MTNETPAGTPETNPIAPAPVKKKGASRIITPVLALVAAVVIGLFAGVLIGHNTASASTPTAGAGFGQGQGFANREGGAGAGGTGTGTGAGGGFAGGAAGGFTAGTIVSVNGDKIVVKETDGTQVTIDTSSSTKVTKTTTSSVSSLKAGQTITVVGAKNGSGDVAATTISEGAGSFGGFRPGGRTGGGAGAGGGTNG